MAEFLVDFGFVPLSNADGRQFLRAHDDGLPFSVEIVQGEHDSFVGFALAASSEDDLQRLSIQTGVPLERDDRPGGQVACSLCGIRAALWWISSTALNASRRCRLASPLHL